MSSDDQSIMIHIAFSGDGFGTPDERQRVIDLEDKLRESIDRSKVGEFDGDGFGDGGADLFAYGPDAEALYAAVEPDIRHFGPSTGSYVLLVFGSDDDAPQRTIPLP